MTDEALVSTRERAGIYDGLESAKPGEPLFTIQGGDRFGPATVLHWADLARTAGRDEANPELAAKLLKKASAAEEVAWAMRSYQRNEQPEDAQRATYSDPEPGTTPEQSAAAARAADRLYNSSAEIGGVIETLAAQRMHPDAEVMLREAADLIRQATWQIEPRRHLQRERAHG